MSAVLYNVQLPVKGKIMKLFGGEVGIGVF